MTVPSATSWSTEARFRTIFEQSPVSTQILSPDGQTLAVNHSWERLWGATLDQLDTYNMLEDPQLVETGVMPYVRRGFAGEALDIPAIKYVPSRTLEVEGAVPYRWVRASIYPVFDDTGTLREVVVMHQDITDQVEAEAALRESEARFRAVFEGAPVGISLIDREGRYLAVNPARQRMLGYSEAELLGRPYLDVTHPDDVEYDRERNEEARELGVDVFQLEKRFLHREGGVEWNRITAAAVRDEDHALQYTISIAEDITAQKEAEAERELLERQKDEFLSAVAHDLRTPLTTIKGRAQILTRRLQIDDPEPGQLLEGLRRIDAGATRMIALINELLDVANIQLGRSLNLRPEETDLVALTAEAVREHQQATDRHEIVLDAVVPNLVGVWDPLRLERVIANLLSNAIKYSPEGGRITVRIGSEQDADGAYWATLRVEDQGVGIPPRDLPYIFDRFHRGENVARRIAGTGIGLAAVREIVEQSGGRVEAQSPGTGGGPGAGTVLLVWLPLPAAPSAPGLPSPR
jgi:PAS domain S-box-containing protein